MNTHNTCFCGEITKNVSTFCLKSVSYLGPYKSLLRLVGINNHNDERLLYV